MNQLLMPNSIKSADEFTSHHYKRGKINDAPNFNFFFFLRSFKLKIKGKLLECLETKLIFGK